MMQLRIEFDKIYNSSSGEKYELFLNLLNISFLTSSTLSSLQDKISKFSGDRESKEFQVFIHKCFDGIVKEDA